MMCTYYFDYKNNILLSVKLSLCTFHYQSPQKNTMPAPSNHVTKKCTESFNGLFNNAGSVSLVYNNPLSRSVHGCINLLFIILSILFNLFICINLVYFFVFLFNYFIYLNFTYSECNASKGLSHN